MTNSTNGLWLYPKLDLGQVTGSTLNLGFSITTMGTAALPSRFTQVVVAINLAALCKVPSLQGYSLWAAGMQRCCFGMEEGEAAGAKGVGSLGWTG